MEGRVWKSGICGQDSNRGADSARASALRSARSLIYQAQPLWYIGPHQFLSLLDCLLNTGLLGFRDLPTISHGAPV